MPPSRAPPSWLAPAGLAATLTFVATVLVLHALSLAAEPEHMSEFALTPLWPAWDMALTAFAFGGAALTWSRRPRLRAGRLAPMGIGMLLASCLGALVLAACPVDASASQRTLLGTIHEQAAPPTFLLAAAAMLVLAPAFHATTGWRPFAGVSIVFGLVALASAFAYVAATMAGEVLAGVVQRILVGSIVSWLLLLAVRLLRHRRNAEAAEAPTAATTSPAEAGRGCTL